MKIGDYVRTKYGIRPIVDLRKNGKDQIIMVIIRGNQLNQIGLKMEYIKKHSPNLIDLIEVGDYVNGYEVVDIDNGYDIETEKTYKQLWTNGNAGYGDSIIIKESEINEVLTKEQYEREVFGV